ncbi:hypothetical protein V2J09_022604 [Rumex salicifolius]
MAGEPEKTMTTTAKKKPLSLNERHNFLLSATSSRYKPPQSTTPSFSLGLEDDPSIQSSHQGGHRPAKLPSSAENELPSFSGIVDFDSPLGASDPSEHDVRISETSKVNIGTSKTSEVIVERFETSAEGSDQNEADVDNHPETANHDVLSEKQKPGKVKIQGRRRLCRVAYTSNDLVEELEDSRDLELADFNSPPREKFVKNEVPDGGANEIRDIESELTAKFHLLSIEKKKIIPKSAEPKPVPVEEDLGDYASAGSSFSKSSNSSSSSSDAGNGFQNKKADDVLNRTEGDSFLGKKDQLISKEVEVDYVLSVSNGEDSEDECIIVESKSLPGSKKFNSHLLKEKHDDSRAILEGDNCKEAGSEDEYVITFKGPKSTYKLSGKIGKMLYPHQRDGLSWLWSLHCQGKGGILGDDMGLGKTMQMCGFLAGLFRCRLIKRVIIVAPKTLLPHWINELAVVGLSEKTREFFGTCSRARQYELQYVLQDGGIILTTYDIVRNNWKQLCQTNSLGDDYDEDEPIWDYMILDEGHLIKNPSTQRAQSLLAVPCAHRIVISGTPIQNNLKELWALFHFCCPDLLGDKKWFKERYENPILRGNDKKATERDKRIGSTVAKELRERIQPYFLRRLKSEVFNEKNDSGKVKLSKKNEIIVWLRLTSVQRRLYEAFLNSELVLSSFDGSPLAAITILKKICDHPYLLTKRAAEDVLEGMDSTLNGEDLDLAAKLAKHVAEFSEDEFQQEHDNVSCKISFIMSLLANLIPQGHNVLIFSQTRKMLNHIQESLLSSGYTYQRIDGTTKASDRLSIVNGAPIFLLTSQVGGLGLTLTKADRVIVVDPAWNPSMDNQSVDRAYRIGQKKDVLVYRLMTCGTIEEKIYRMQDLKELFSLPKDGFDVSPTQQQLYEEHHHQMVLSDSLKAHMKFLDSLGIGGVSHHSLLYSKTEPTPALQDEDLVRVKETMTMRNTHSYNVPKRQDDGADFAKFALNPRDSRVHQSENKPSDSKGKITESQIMERITRLSHLLSNKATISRLPDSGSKIRRQLEGLNSELDRIRNSKNNEVINLDDDDDDGITDMFNTSLKI